MSILKLFWLKIIFLLPMQNMTFLKFHNLSLNFGLLDRSKYYTTKFTFTSKYYINLFVKVFLMIVIKQIKNSKWYFYPFLYPDGKKSLQTCMFYLLNSSFLLLNLIFLIIWSTSIPKLNYIFPLKCSFKLLPIINLVSSWTLINITT